MKRNPRKLKWTKAFRTAAGKEMTVDSTLNFAARRNVPVRYDRDLVAKTLKAMGRISEIRARRERAFYKRRMAGKRQTELRVARRLVAENEHLLPRMRASERVRLAEEQGVPVEEVVVDAREVARKAAKTKVFGKEVRRQKLTADGGVEEVIEREEGVRGVGDDDMDDDDDEDSEDGDSGDDDEDVDMD